MRYLYDFRAFGPFSEGGVFSIFVGGSEAQKKVCAPKIGLKLPAPSISCTFCRRNIFLMWGGVGGGVDRG